MKKKILGIFVCTLLITVILPVSASYEENNEIETPRGFSIEKTRYIGIISGYTIKNFTNAQFYMVDFINGFTIETGFYSDKLPGFGMHQLRDVMRPIRTENFRGILTNHLCIGVERVYLGL